MCEAESNSLVLCGLLRVIYVWAAESNAGNALVSTIVSTICVWAAESNALVSTTLLKPQHCILFGGADKTRIQGF